MNRNNAFFVIVFSGSAGKYNNKGANFNEESPNFELLSKKLMT